MLTGLQPNTDLTHPFFALRYRLLIGGLVLAIALGCSSERGDRLDQVRQLQASGQFDQAVSLLREIAAGDDNSPEADFMLGKALLRASQPVPAAKALERASRDELYALPAGLLLASSLFEHREFDGSIRAASRVLEIEPGNPIALLTQGRALLASGHPDEALADALALLKIDPSHHNAALLEGSALVDLGRRDEAEKVWINLYTRMSAQGSPDQAARACAELALFYRTQQEDEAADAIYTKCLKQYPTDAYLQRWASDFYMRKGEPDRAVALYREAVNTAPDDLRLRARLANVLLSFRERAEAEETLEETVARFDSAGAWQLLANFHAQTGDAREARSALEESLERTTDPQQPTLFALADLLVEEGNLDRARKIGSSLTDPTYQHLLESAIQLRSGSASKALVEIDKAIETAPRSPRAHYLAGRAALASGDRDRASDEFRKALVFGETKTDAASRLAEINFSAGHFRSAWNFAQRRIVRRPYGSQVAYLIAVRCAIELGNFESAKKTADALDQVDPDGVIRWVARAEIIRREQGPEASAEWLLKSLDNVSEPAVEPVLRGLIEDLNQLDRAEEGLAYIDAAIARNDQQPDLFDLRARALSHLERFDEARESARRALTLDPTFAPALETRAFLALEADDAKAAIAFLRRAADAAPLNAAYSHAAASIARKTGDEASAILLLEEALTRQPRFPQAANDLAWLLADSGTDLDRALSLARQAVNRTHDANSMDTLGWVLYQRGEYEQAVKSFRAAIAARPDLRSAAYRLGVALAAMGETDEARAVLEKLVEGPDFPEIEKARAELERIKNS